MKARLLQATLSTLAFNGLIRHTEATTSTTASIDLDPYVQISEADISDTEKTVNYQPFIMTEDGSGIFTPCTCDLTSNSCDAFCCCDTDCPQVTTETWDTDRQCTDVVYPQANGLPLSACIDRHEMYEFNKRHGISNYMDPFARLFCVKYDWSPIMDHYWEENPDAEQRPTPTSGQQEKNPGFTKAVQGAYSVADNTSSIQGRKYYDLGETIKTEVKEGTDESQKDLFIIPSPNVYGGCNNFHQARFMEGEETECAQIITDLEQQCRTTLNPTFYTSNIAVHKGKAASDPLDVIVAEGEIYRFIADESSNTFEYSELAESGAQIELEASEFVSDGVSKTCKGALKEVEYTFTVKIKPCNGRKEGEFCDSNEYAHLEIIKVAARVVIADIVQQEGDTTNMHVQQKFSLEFSEEGTSVGLSGNPGYIVGLPLLLGKSVLQDDKQAIETHKGGFVGTGSKPDGECWETQDVNHAQHDDPVVTFGQDLSYGCTIKMTKAQLDTFCGASPLAEYEIFKNLLEIEKVGQFGSANYHLPKDWLPVADNTLENSGTAEQAGTCKIYANVHYRIYWAEMGFTQNLQKYIVEMEKTTEEEIWTHNRADETEAQDFHVGVSFQFVPIGNVNVKEVNMLADMFYPFIGGQSGAFQALSTVFAVSTAAAVLSF